MSKTNKESNEFEKLLEGLMELQKRSKPFEYTPGKTPELMVNKAHRRNDKGSSIDIRV